MSICSRDHFIAVVVVFALSVGCGKTGAPDREDQDPNLSEQAGEVDYDPENPYGVYPTPTDYEGERNFAQIMNKYAKGRPRKTPWVGYWWPYTINGIASGRYSGGISSAGKYDAARGNQTGA